MAPLLSTDSLCNAHSAPSPKDANPFLAAEEVKEDPCLELALQALAAETSRRTSSEWRMSLTAQSSTQQSLLAQTFKETFDSLAAVTVG